jgi:magnesium transporter
MLSRVGEASRRIWISTCSHQYFSIHRWTLPGQNLSIGTTLIRRNKSWKAALGSFGWANQKNDGFGNVSDNEEDAVRAAILDKALKGRQPSDLMLRCESSRVVLVE